MVLLMLPTDLVEFVLGADWDAFQTVEEYVLSVKNCV